METDTVSIRMAVKDGERRLVQLQSLVGHTQDDENSWVNIKDDEDPRGRVGYQWPWEREDKIHVNAIELKYILRSGFSKLSVSLCWMNSAR